jgi:hypothetical protein
MSFFYQKDTIKANCHPHHTPYGMSGNIVMERIYTINHFPFDHKIKQQKNVITHLIPKISFMHNICSRKKKINNKTSNKN